MRPASDDLLGQIGRIEQALEREPLDRRIAACVPAASRRRVEHPLDRAAWHALTGPQAGYAIGDAFAMRFHPDIGPLAAPRDHSPEAIAALVALAPTEGVLATILARPMDLPPTVEIVRCSPALQMVMDAPPAPFDHPDIELLGPGDAAEMRALAELTEPGPFSTRTQELGTFWGIREHGRIIAMAGERMRFAGLWRGAARSASILTARGGGLGALLTRKAAATVGARGLKPFPACLCRQQARHRHLRAGRLPASARR